jgi:hypothetical protein
MASTIKLTGNLLIQLAEGAVPAPVPVGFEMSYTEKVIYDFSYVSSQTNVAVPQGSIGNPRFVLVFLYSGSISLSWDAGGAAPTVITANPTPPPSDRPLMMLFRYNAPTSQLYLSSPAAARGAIWIFE